MEERDSVTLPKLTLAEAMDRVWFTPAPVGTRSFPSKELLRELFTCLTPVARNQVGEIHKRRVATSRPAHDEVHWETLKPMTGTALTEGRSLTNEEDVIRTLSLMILAHHYVNDLVIEPPKQRNRRFAEAASWASVATDELLDFCNHWWEELEKDVYKKSL